jgi:DNA-binding NarL/FixJ family response regulator
VLAPAVLARVMDHFATRPPLPARKPPGFNDLSEREREVIGTGRSNAEIADELVISMATVKTHVRHVFAKLGLRCRSHAVVVAREAGLVSGPDGRGGVPGAE